MAHGGSALQKVYEQWLEMGFLICSLHCLKETIAVAEGRPSRQIAFDQAWAK